MLDHTNLSRGRPGRRSRSLAEPLLAVASCVIVAIAALFLLDGGMNLQPNPVKAAPVARAQAAPASDHQAHGPLQEASEPGQ
jgi:hypothetical protein